MTQYCRYCIYCSVQLGDEYIYCMEKEKFKTAKYAKHSNECSDFDLCSMDAFGENEKGYRTHKKRKTQVDGQIYLKLEDMK